MKTPQPHLFASSLCIAAAAGLTGCLAPTPMLTAITETKANDGSTTWSFGYTDAGFLSSIEKKSVEGDAESNETWSLNNEDQGLNGTPLVSATYEVDGELGADVTFQRGSGNRLEGCKNDVGDGKTTFTTGGGNLTKMEFVDDDESSVVNYVYDALGDLTALEGETTDTDGTRKQKIAVEYDDNENIGAFVFTVDGDPFADVHFDYNDNRAVSVIEFVVHQDQDVILRSEVSYDDDGRVAGLARTAQVDDGDPVDFSDVEFAYVDGDAAGLSTVPQSFFTLPQLFDLRGASRETVSSTNMDGFCLPAW